MAPRVTKMAPKGVMVLGCRNMYHLKPERERPKKTEKTARNAGKGFIEDSKVITFDMSAFESTQYSARTVMISLTDISRNLRNFAKGLHKFLKTEEGI
jgi:hypothetical protein